MLNIHTYIHTYKLVEDNLLVSPSDPLGLLEREGKLSAHETLGADNSLTVQPAKSRFHENQAFSIEH